MERPPLLATLRIEPACRPRVGVVGEICRVGAQLQTSQDDIELAQAGGPQLERMPALALLRDYLSELARPRSQGRLQQPVFLMTAISPIFSALTDLKQTDLSELIQTFPLRTMVPRAPPDLAPAGTSRLVAA
jgi:hypothetical protein